MKKLTLKEVIAKVGLSKSSIARLESEGKFPRRQDITMNRVGWLESDIQTWLEKSPPSKFLKTSGRHAKLLMVILAIFMVTGCRGETRYGKCVGVDEVDRDPKLVYEVSIRNAVMSILGFQFIIPPILWLTSYAYCPVGEKEIRK